MNAIDRTLAATYRPVTDLIPYAGNARTHSDAQVAEIAASIRAFGFTNPILVDGENGLIAGHGRFLAARKLGMAEVPVIELAGMSDAEKRAYVFADNKLALNAGWAPRTAPVRFVVAGALFWIALFAFRVPVPNGRALVGALLYGFVGFFLTFAFAFWGLRDAPPGTGGMILGLVPLLTMLLARFSQAGGAEIAGSSRRAGCGGWCRRAHGGPRERRHSFHVAPSDRSERALLC